MGQIVILSIFAGFSGARGFVFSKGETWILTIFFAVGNLLDSNGILHFKLLYKRQSGLILQRNPT